MLSKQSNCIGERPLKPAESLEREIVRSDGNQRGRLDAAGTISTEDEGYGSTFQVAEKASGSYRHLALLRWSMVGIFSLVSGYRNLPHMRRMPSRP